MVVEAPSNRPLTSTDGNAEGKISNKIAPQAIVSFRADSGHSPPTSPMAAADLQVRDRYRPNPDSHSSSSARPGCASSSRSYVAQLQTLEKHNAKGSDIQFKKPIPVHQRADCPACKALERLTL